MVKSSSRELDGANTLSLMKGSAVKPGEIVRKQRIKTPSLTIINPDILGGGDNGKRGLGGSSSSSSSSNDKDGTPSTPWEKEVMALDRDRRESFNKTSVSTPSAQKDFLSKVRRCVQAGDATALQLVLRAADRNTGGIMGEGSAADEVKEEGGAKEDSGGGNKKQKVLDSDNTADASNADTASNDVAAAAAAPSSPGAIITSTLNRLDSKKGRSVLMLACSLDPAMFDETVSLTLARLLIEHGASPRFVDATGNSCLHLAAARGYHTVAKLLLNRGCPVNQCNTESNTALHISAMFGHAQFIEVLVDFGANCHLRNANNMSALDVFGTTKETKERREELRRVMLSIEPRLRTLILYHEDCLEHTARRADDWEGPDRLMGIMQRLQNREEFPEHVLEISTTFDKAGVELLSRAHSAEYITFVDNLSKKLQSASTRSKAGVVPFTPQVRILLYFPSFS
jgi:ankyrin repeat protein